MSLRPGPEELVTLQQILFGKVVYNKLYILKLYYYILYTIYIYTNIVKELNFLLVQSYYSIWSFFGFSGGNLRRSVSRISFGEARPALKGLRVFSVAVTRALAVR